MKDNVKAGSGSKLAQYGMWACCIVMLVPVGAYLLAGGASGGTLQTITAFAPLSLCLGMHLVMHKMMGRSCHGHSDKTAEEIPEKPALLEHRPDVKGRSIAAE